MITKSAQVVMLPQDKDGWSLGDLVLCVDMIMRGANSIGTLSVPNYSYPSKNPYHEPQHLYIVTDEQIEEEDWYYVPFSKKIKQYFEKPDRVLFRDGLFKIVASTDTSLGLPSIPKQWIKDVFCKLVIHGEYIGEVYVPSYGIITTTELETEQWCQLLKSSNTLLCSRCQTVRPECHKVKVTTENVVVFAQPHTIYTHPEENVDRLDKMLNLLDKMNEIIIADAELEKQPPTKQWTDEDMRNAWNQAAGIEWDNQNGYYSPDFEEWLQEYKKEQNI